MVEGGGERWWKGERTERTEGKKLWMERKRERLEKVITNYGNGNGLGPHTCKDK